MSTLNLAASRHARAPMTRSSTLDAESRTVFGSAILVTGLAGSGLLGMVSAAGLSPLLPLLAADLGSSVAVLGQAAALLNLLAAMLGFVVGPVTDHHGARRVLLAGLVAAALSSLATAASASVVMILLSAAIGALGRASIQPAAFAIAATRFDDEARRRAISWTQVGVSCATLLGLPLLAGLAQMLGWRVALLAFSALTLAFALLQRRILPAAGWPAHAGGAFRISSVFRAYRTLLWHWPTLGVVGATLLGQIGFWATLTFLGAFLVHVYGLSISEAGAVYAAGGLGLLFGNLAASGPLGRFPLRGVLATSRLAQVPLLFGILVMSPPVPVIIILLLLAGILHGASTALGMTLVTIESPAGRATTVTLNQSALTLGVALAGALGGLVLAFTSYRVLGMGLTLPGCGAALLLWWTRPRRSPRNGGRQRVASTSYSASTMP